MTFRSSLIQSTLKIYQISQIWYIQIAVGNTGPASCTEVSEVYGKDQR